MIERNELQRVRAIALDMAMCDGLSPTWGRAYIELADACDRLDAMISRTVCDLDPDVSEVATRLEIREDDEGNPESLTLYNIGGSIVAKLYIDEEGNLDPDSWLCHEGWSNEEIDNK